MDDDELLLPHLDERGYEILLDEDGNEVFDENGDPVAATYSCMQIEAVDFIDEFGRLL